jgi:cytidylate kinase
MTMLFETPPMLDPSSPNGWSWTATEEDTQNVKVITIDGPAGSGKSTVARAAAQHLGWIYVNTGAIYRTFALMLHEAGTTVADRGSVERFIAFLAERYRQDSRSGRVFLGEREVTHEIRSPFISEKASMVAQDELVRKRLLPVQRRVVLDCNGAIVDGRDMGTVVFPDAPLKFYLLASAEERARRRAVELRGHGQEIDVSELVKEIFERDNRDANRAVSPMKPADDAIMVDSTQINPDEVVNQILKHAHERGLIPHYSGQGV